MRDAWPKGGQVTYQNGYYWVAYYAHKWEIAQYCTAKDEWYRIGTGDTALTRHLVVVGPRIELPEELK